MPKYFYSAKSQPRETIQGNIEAESEQDAINKLNRMGYFPISVQAEDLSVDRHDLLRFWKVSHKDITIFTRQLSTLIESGVNIITGLNIIQNQIPNKYLKAILNDVIGKIKDGKSLSESLAFHRNLFSDLYTSLLRSGEAGGTIEETLKRLADFLEKEQEFKSSVRAALVYPLFILSVSIMTIIVLLGFVIPRLVSMFQDMGQILPLPTKVLINISGFLREFWWMILASIFAFVFLIKRLNSRPAGKIMLDRARLRLPVLGTIVLKTEISRLMRTMSLLLSSGLPIVSALDVCTSVLENQILKAELHKFKEKIAGGESFSHCLTGSQLFPAFVTNIVTVGEEAGTLEKSLMRIADDYERQVDKSLKSLTQLLEPVIILVMGVVVGFIVLSMLLPIFQINLLVR